MNRKCVWLLLVAVAIVAMTIPFEVSPASAQVAGTSPWPMFRQNPDHTAVGQGTSPTYMVVNWKFATGGPIQSSPSIVNGLVYFGSMDGYWYCINATTGTFVWKFKTLWQPQSSAAIVNGLMYTGADDGYVYCLNANTGALVWKTMTVGGPLSAYTSVDTTPYQLRGSPCVANGLVYVGGLDDYVYCLNANNGTIVWKYLTGGPIACTPAIDSGKVYIGSGDAYMYCLNANTGAVIWKFLEIMPGETVSRGLGGSGEQQQVGSPCVAQGTVYFFGEAGARYWALNATNGKPIWLFWPRRQRYNYQNPSPLAIKVGGVHPGDQPGDDPIGARTAIHVYISPAYLNGRLYIEEDYYMQVLNASTGIRFWAPYPGMLNPAYTDFIGNATLYGATQTQLVTPGTPYSRAMNPQLNLGFGGISSPMVTTDGKMIMGADEQAIYCNDAITGQRYSWYETQGLVQSSPSLAYGMVYVGSQDWNLYCFKDGGVSTFRNVSTGTYRTSTTITGTLSSGSIALGNSITITGSETPSGLSNAYKGAPSVIAFFYKPDGTVFQDTWHLDSNSYGWYVGAPTYTFSYVPDEVGTYTVFVRLHSMQFDPWLPSATGNMTFTVTDPPSSSTTAPITSSVLTIISILATPALAAVPIATILHKRKTK